jgi:tRNA (guanine-N7-)-methyltransferase
MQQESQDSSSADLFSPVPERLYGRRRGHKLRARQKQLLAEVLPRLAIDPANPLAGLEGFAEIWLEIGAGSGEHALAQIARHPEVAFIASEVYLNGLCALLGRLVPEQAVPAQAPLPANLRLWPHDARVLLKALPDATLSRLFVLFPDPWPKSRHAKRRLVHPQQIPLLARALRPGALWRLASDDPTYQAWVEAVMAKQNRFALIEARSVRPPGWPPTRYEIKALQAGRTPRYWTFQRV